MTEDETFEALLGSVQAIMTDVYDMYVNGFG
jgi:hypothetical protein